MDFADVVITEFKTPLAELCKQLMAAGEIDQFIYFSGVLDMLNDPSDEFSVIAASIELSRCAFLGFQYTSDVQEQVNQILDQAITLSATMSSDSLQ